MAYRFLTDEMLREHCKADGDDNNVRLYGLAAEAVAEQKLNRNLYAHEDDLIAARVEARAALSSAWSTYLEARKNAGTDRTLLSLAERDYDRARADALRKLNGMVVNDAIIGAMLMHACHLYSNRADVVTGQYAQAQEVPHNSDNIYRLYRYFEGT